MSSLRAECNGLPLGFEETVSDLVAAGHVQLYQSGAGDSSSLFFAEESIAQHLADDSSVFDQEMSDEEIAQVLEKVLVFKEVQNYLAAINVLQSAIEIASTVAEFHYQLASLYEAFEGDTGAAIEAIDRAILLAPDNQTYRGFRLRL